MLKRSKLLTPLSFLRLESADLFRYQWGIPGALTIASLIVYYILPTEPLLLGSEGLVARMNGLLGTLIGFYIAALAAVATFPNAKLDETMKGRAPKLAYQRGGENRVETLTRRRFLSVLFGYSAFLSIALYGFGILTFAIEPSIEQGLLRRILSVVWIASYAFMLNSLTVVTLLGLSYLIERMHRD
ncbi:MAG: hypothetical protein KDJ36_01945 [Hyphomicrobiaceae bacterium]|nr:hypothetical protein [Hyphomicrobiaceae bacterium]